MAPLTNNHTSPLVPQESSNDENATRKRTHDDKHSSDIVDDIVPSNNNNNNKKQRSSYTPATLFVGKESASRSIFDSTHSSSLYDNNSTSSKLSPVQLLRTFQLPHNRKRAYNSACFVKPSEKDLASYDIALVKAVRTSNLETLKSLHKEGKSLNACNKFSESLLHMACRRGDPAIIRFMIEEAKCNVNVRDDYGRTILHDATWTSKPNFEVMDILLGAMECDMLLAEDVRGHTPFHYARREHWSDWIDFLSTRKSDIESESLNERAVVHQQLIVA